MKRVLLSIVVMLLLALSLQSQPAPDAGDLTRLLNDFLAGASRNDPAMHERFWAEDLIYTSASGRRMGKADILNDVRSSPTLKRGETTTYTAEDIRIHQYGNTAVVAFRLVSKVENNGKTTITRYLNSGTFLKRGGKWQVVSWQATRLPRSDEQSKTDIAGVEAAYHQATLASDINTLESLLDEGFTWTRGAGEQVTRQQLLDQLRTGQLKYSKLETDKVTVNVYGDTGVVRGVTMRQRSASPGSGASADTAPFTAFYTLTFINKGGAWKVVAMHTSRQ